MKTCIYCGTTLIRYTHHPSWWVCPKCEPKMVTEATPDQRGQPSAAGGK